MEMARQSWFHNSWRIWRYYLAIGVATIPAAVAGTLLINFGYSENATIVFCVSFVLLLATLWKVWEFFTNRKTAASKFYVEIKVHVIASSAKNITVVAMRPKYGKNPPTIPIVRIGNPVKPAPIQSFQRVA